MLTWNLYINTKGRFTEKIMMIDLYMPEIFNFSTFGKKGGLEVWATKIPKDRYTMAHFWVNCKKVKIEVTGPKKAQFFFMFLGPVTWF